MMLTRVKTKNHTYEGTVVDEDNDKLRLVNTKGQVTLMKADIVSREPFDTGRAKWPESD